MPNPRKESRFLTAFEMTNSHSKVRVLTRISI
jgi:hypothetical protein